MEMYKEVCSKRFDKIEQGVKEVHDSVVALDDAIRKDNGQPCVLSRIKALEEVGSKKEDGYLEIGPHGSIIKIPVKRGDAVKIVLAALILGLLGYIVLAMHGVNPFLGKEKAAVEEAATAGVRRPLLDLVKK